MTSMEKVLFEIPVYAMRRETFDAKYSEFINNKTEGFTEYERIVENIKSHYFLLGIWKFNQIIGYIQIVATDACFEFRFWLGDKKRYNIDAKSKPMISYLDQCYVRYAYGESNQDFRRLLSEKLSRLYDTWHIKHRYIDVTTFDNLAPYIDFAEIVKEAMQNGAIKISENDETEFFELSVEG